MNLLDWGKLHQAQCMLVDCIAAADAMELRRIGQILDELKSTVDDNIMTIAGGGGDY